MTTTIQTTDLRRRVREVLDRLQEEGEPVIVRSYGRPQAVLIPYPDFEEYRAWQARHREREAWLAELGTIAREVSARAALTDEEAEALIEEARRDDTRRL